MTRRTYPRVDLLAVTPDAEALIVQATRTCYDSFEHSSPESDQALMETVIKSGHHSVLEHASATFKITGSRVLTHELVRHRLASYSQRSQRFVREGELAYLLPPEVEEKGDAAVLTFEAAMGVAHTAYQDLLRLGVPRQYARYVLPNAWLTTVVATFNFRELRHVIELRGSKQAQPEFRSVALKMLVLALHEAPNVFADLRPMLKGDVPQDVQTYIELLKE